MWGHTHTYPGCSFPHHCGPCSPTRRHSASAEGCSGHGSGRETHLLCTPLHSQSVSKEIIKTVHSSDVVSCNQRKPKPILFFCCFWSCTHLIWAIQTVVMSITPQAGWHTPSAGTYVLVDGTRRGYWRRAKDISQQPAFSQLQNHSGESLLL